ncbi:testin [Aulostomus maculatus]
MEIEKEVKKMTLGHEFGAGAACLKCKDKCEGFELHFWRKICRNCKCGLADHNVQMNSEENMKVGKLFEDTKYTGLIAKLKTDGIPGSQGSMVTITLPTPAMAYTLPPRASSTVVPPAAAAGSVQPAGAPGVPTPSAPISLQGQGQATQGRPGQGHDTQGRPGQGQDTQGRPGQGQDTQGRPGQGQAAQVRLTPASVTAARANRMPVPVSAMSATAEPVPKDVPMMSVTYEWAPPVANKYLAVRYIELLPPERRPVAGSEGAAYRRQQMARQLPEHDQDPSKCHELSPAEVKQMQQYVRKYKDEALGIGDVRLPEEMVLVQAGQAGAAGPGPEAAGPGAARAGAAGPGAAGAGGAGSRPGAGSGVAGPGVGVVGCASGAGIVSGPGIGAHAGLGPAGGAMGAAVPAGALGVPGSQQAGQPQQAFSCSHCQQPMRLGEPAVYAERAGYDKMWHPACFVCCTCKELLVDMIYFWKKGKLYCGRHYGDSEKPRCSGCDELIFCNEYTQAEGQNWHLKHFCCFDCDSILAGETYVMEEDKPVCKPCYMKSHAVICVSCQNAVEPEAQRVSYGEHHWHAEPDCFKCSGCSKCLVGQRFMAVQRFLFCSMECKKKTMT